MGIVWQVKWVHGPLYSGSKDLSWSGCNQQWPYRSRKVLDFPLSHTHTQMRWGFLNCAAHHAVATITNPPGIITAQCHNAHGKLWHCRVRYWWGPELLTFHALLLFFNLNDMILLLLHNNVDGNMTEYSSTFNNKQWHLNDTAACLLPKSYHTETKREQTTTMLEITTNIYGRNIKTYGIYLLFYAAL